LWSLWSLPARLLNSLRILINRSSITLLCSIVIPIIAIITLEITLLIIVIIPSTLIVVVVIGVNRISYLISVIITIIIIIIPWCVLSMHK